MPGGEPADRIGLLGGTFDPPHNGHVTLATACLEGLGLDRVLVIVTGHPPHKASLTPFSHRLEMARRAFAFDERFEIDPLEGERDGPSYTIDTLRAVRRREGETASFWLLMGSDSLQELATWRRPLEIVRACRLGVYCRPGFDPSLASRSWVPFVDLVEGPEVDVSSTDVRRRVGCGEDITEFVPQPVLEYIGEHGLYLPRESGSGSGR